MKQINEKDLIPVNIDRNMGIYKRYDYLKKVVFRVNRKKLKNKSENLWGSFHYTHYLPINLKDYKNLALFKLKDNKNTFIGKPTTIVKKTSARLSVKSKRGRYDCNYITLRHPSFLRTLNNEDLYTVEWDEKNEWLVFEKIVMEEHKK